MAVGVSDLALCKTLLIVSIKNPHFFPYRMTSVLVSKYRAETFAMDTTTWIDTDTNQEPQTTDKRHRREVESSNSGSLLINVI